MTENKYGNLLDKFANGEKTNDYNGMLDSEKQKCIKESENRYGNLLRNVSQNSKHLDTMENMVNSMDNLKRKRAEENRQFDERLQNRIEREKQGQEERTGKNNVFINDFLQKKRTEQEREEIKAQEREREKMKEAEEQKAYSNIDRLMSINPKLADAYVGVMANR